MTTKYRYRESWGGGVTNLSLKAFNKHVSKIGEVSSVKGYIYFGQHKTNHIGVLLTGTKGTLRLGGLSWGYGGEGVRGLRVILTNLGCPEDEIKRVTAVEWTGWSTGLPKGMTKLAWVSYPILW